MVGMCVWLCRMYSCLYLNIEDFNIFMVYEKYVYDYWIDI